MKIVSPCAAFLILAATGTFLPRAAAQTISSVNSWYSFGTGGSATMSGSTVSLNPANSTTSISAIGYFDSNPMTVGQTLTLSFNLSYATPANAITFRFGLFNSGGAGSQITSNLTTTSDSKFSDDAGYASNYELYTAGTANAYQIDSRTSGGSNQTFWTSGAFSTPSSTSSGATAANTPISATLVLTYVSATDMKVTSTVGGLSFTQDFSSPITTFDSLSFFDSGANGVVSLSAIQVSLASVPEPSLLLPLGLLGAFCLGLRRRMSPAVLPSPQKSFGFLSDFLGGQITIMPRSGI